MSQIIYLTKGDSGPDVTFSLTDHDSEAPVDLTGLSSSVLKFRAVGTTTVLQTISLSVVSPATNGQLLLVWPSGALNVNPGFYEGEIELTFTGPKVLTAYRRVRFYVQDQF
jgi:hypothetical protein